MAEEWRPIKDFEGYYEVSNYGNVRSLNYRHTNKTEQMRLSTVLGYKTVQLKAGGKQGSYKVHRLVANAFIPNPNNYPQVNHIDENKQNNSVSNLEWCNAKYNNNFGTRGNRIRNSLRENSPENKPVALLDKNGNIQSTYRSMAEAARETKTDYWTVWNSCYKKKKTKLIFELLQKEF